MGKILDSFSNIRYGFATASESLSIKDVYLLKQIHSFLVVKPSDFSLDSLPEADAWVCAQKGYKIAVKTADCAPLLMTDGRIISAVHAGWKGALNGVIEQALLAMLQMGAVLDEICVAVGPCLQKRSFIVQEDMKNLFSKDTHSFFSLDNDEIHFDFEGFIAYRLQKAGIQKSEFSHIDTFTDTSYNSYRREPENKQRQYSWIELV